MAIFAIITLNLFLRFFRLNVPPFVYLDEKNFFVPAAKSLLTQSTEPPYTIISFGKVLIASGIRLFGDTPISRYFNFCLSGRPLDCSPV